MAQKTSKSLSPRGRFWWKHFQQWQRSDTTQIQYCQEHSLSVAAFRWWRRELTQGHTVMDPPKELPPVSVPTFTEIRIPEGGAAAAAYPYEIVLPNRTQLRLRQNFDAEAVPQTLIDPLGRLTLLGTGLDVVFQPRVNGPLDRFQDRPGLTQPILRRKPQRQRLRYRLAECPNASAASR
jgi:hypothetical protein